MNAPATMLKTPAPEWERVRFSVECPRCGTDLRGQTDPKCRRCGLDFDWSELIPIEALRCAGCGYRLFGLNEERCPECGKAFDWAERILDCRRRASPLFEFWWRSRFLRSFYGTWRMALRPGKLWRTVRLHHKPESMPIIGFVGVTLAVSCLSMTAADLISHVVWAAMRVWKGWFPGTPWWQVIADVSTLRLSVMSMDPSFICLCTAWMGSHLACLMLFSESMRRLGLRMHHLLRVWCYAVVPTLPLAFLMGTLSINLADLAYRFMTGSEMLLQVTSALLLASIVLSLGHSTWSMRQGLAHYVRMPHAIGVALAVQLIAGMTGLVASLIPIIPMLWHWR